MYVYVYTSKTKAYIQEHSNNKLVSKYLKYIVHKNGISK